MHFSLQDKTIKNSMGEYLQVITPYLNSDLVSSQALSYLQTITQMLPTYPIGGLECRLSDQDSRVDFFAYVPHGLINIPQSYQNNQVWQSLREFSQIWTQPTSTLAQNINVVGLEFDLDIDPSKFVIPCIFFALNRNSLTEDNDWEKLIDYWPFTTLFNSANSAPLRSNLQNCIHNLPSKAWIAHLGTMLSRSSQMVRIVVKDILPQQLVPYLTQIGWTEPTNKLADLVTTLSEFVDYIALDLDVGESIYPQIGLECRIEKQSLQDSRWEKFLDYLVSQGLCTEAKQQSLLSWIGITQKSDCPDLWPSSLMMGDLFAGNDALSIFYRRIYHIKIVYQHRLPLSAKAYLEFGHRWLDRRLVLPEKPKVISSSMSDASKPAQNDSQYRQQVRDYYERMASIIVQDVGNTYQAGLLKQDADKNIFKLTNLYCASQAGIKSGDRILDAGCGACGPSIDIANHIQGVKIDAITVSSQQANIAQDLIRESKLSEQIKVHIGDYHELPFASETFDVVIFLESIGYSYDPHLLYSEVYRVLRPGGIIYIKESFIKESHLSILEKQELDNFNQDYMCRPTRMSETVETITKVGFENVIQQDLSHILSGEKAIDTMFEEKDGKKVLTEFGKAHYRQRRHLPIVFGEVKAYKLN